MEPPPGTEISFPVSYDLAWIGLIVLSAALIVAAVIGILRARGKSTTSTFIWTLVVICIPLLGPLAWFAHAFSLKDSRRRQSTGRTERPSEGAQER